MLRTARLFLLPLAAAALLAACHDDPAPDQPKKPDAPVGSTELRDAIQRPIDSAKAVEGKLQDAKEKQDKQIENQGG